MSSAPYMKLYFSDLAGDTLALSDAEMGSYLLLIGAMWNAGGRLDARDQEALCRIARCSESAWPKRWGKLARFFEVGEGEITHKRVTAAREQVAATSVERAVAGSAGGKARAAKALKNKASGKAKATDLPEGLLGADDGKKQAIPESIDHKDANASSGAARAATEQSSRRKPETTIPADFPDAEAKVDAANRAAQERAQLDVSREAERFRNHAAQNDRRCRDWRAAWRNWIVGAVERAPKLPGPSPTPAANVEAPRWAGPPDFIHEARTGGAEGALHRARWQEVPFKAVIAKSDFDKGRLDFAMYHYLFRLGVQIIREESAAA